MIKHGINIFQSIAELGNCVPVVIEVAKQTYRPRLSNRYRKEEAAVMKKWRKKDAVL